MCESDPVYRKASNRQFFRWVAIMLIIAFSLRLFVIEPIRVEGDSMYPTLHDEERMLVTKFPYWFSAPEPGDIIICFYPGYTKSCVKRVIAVGGDTVYITGGRVYVNGQPLDEAAYWNDYVLSEYPAEVVPDGCVFVMGDNRNHSTDSRSSLVGAIPLYRVVGRVEAVVWPLTEMRAVEHG